ncbi:hypothetical protein HK101_008962 [Irineochytrium annulatum]|nr:hypothetical protein HK101_008962 [Irineochytrium annulatum]
MGVSTICRGPLGGDSAVALEHASTNGSAFAINPFDGTRRWWQIPRRWLGSGRRGDVFEVMVYGFAAVTRVVDPYNQKMELQATLTEARNFEILRALQGNAVVAVAVPPTWCRGFFVFATWKVNGGGGVRAKELMADDKALALSSLKRIHDVGWIHGDVRGENVVFEDAPEGRLALWIDLEWASEATVEQRQEEWSRALAMFEA